MMAFDMILNIFRGGRGGSSWSGKCDAAQKLPHVAANNGVMNA